MTAARGALLGGALSIMAAFALGAAGVDPSLHLGKAQGAYLLGCGGCHGEAGRSNSRLVPDLRDLAGYYLRTQAGREYLVRLPNVSFYTASDEELAQILNYVAFTLGAGAPEKARPYRAAEVAKLRRAPLTEVSLIKLRAEIVEDLIANHGAPPSLRTYGATQYAQSGP